MCSSDLKTTLNRFAKTLDKILYTLPTKLIGQKSLILKASFFLGINAMKVTYNVEKTLQRPLRRLSPLLSNNDDKMPW